MAELYNTSQYLSTLINAGSDLQSNLYYVEITAPSELESSIGELSTGLTVRNTDLDLPAFSQGTHPVNYMTVSTEMPSAEIVGDKTIRLSFRLDAHYNVYKFLKAWQAYTSSGNLGYALTSIPGESDTGVSGTYVVRVYSLDEPASAADMEAPGTTEGGLSKGKLLYEYDYCWLESLSGLDLSYENASTVTITANIRFYSMTADPMTQLLK